MLHADEREAESGGDAWEVGGRGGGGGGLYSGGACVGLWEGRGEGYGWPSVGFRAWRVWWVAVGLALPLRRGSSVTTPVGTRLRVCARGGSAFINVRAALPGSFLELDA
ncbi:hypothetical protein D1007_11243 [Hordeum vulgare]|nr:hypothetical protein D1007_11243 [Hordeum vulgare]